MILFPLPLNSNSSSDEDAGEGSLRSVVRSFPVALGGEFFGGEGERWNGMWWWWDLRGGKSGSMVGWGGGGAGEELRDEARAAPMMALERDSPVMCFVIAFTDSR